MWIVAEKTGRYVICHKALPDAVERLADLWSRGIAGWDNEIHVVMTYNEEPEDIFRAGLLCGQHKPQTFAWAIMNVAWAIMNDECLSDIDMQLHIGDDVLVVRVPPYNVVRRAIEERAVKLRADMTKFDVARVLDVPTWAILRWRED